MFVDTLSAVAHAIDWSLVGRAALNVAGAAFRTVF